VFDTSADALRTRLVANGALSWEQPDAQADPREDEIYSVKLPNGNAFRLEASHIMTKDLDHWLWITLWWSDPNQDFGSDRPATLSGPWQHYKCAW